MLVFEKPGKENTQRAVLIALEKAQELHCPIITASNKGETPKALLHLMEEKGLIQQVFVVTHVAGFTGKGEVEMPQAVQESLEGKGMVFITAAHALSAGERALSNAKGGIYPLEVAAKTLKMFGQGTKVCVEIAVMAMDTGKLPYGAPVVALGGSGQGADTAIVLTPGYTANLFDTKIHEILCKPGL